MKNVLWIFLSYFLISCTSSGDGKDGVTGATPTDNADMTLYLYNGSQEQFIQESQEISSKLSTNLPDLLVSKKLTAFELNQNSTPILLKHVHTALENVSQVKADFWMSDYIASGKPAPRDGIIAMGTCSPVGSKIFLEATSDVEGITVPISEVSVRLYDYLKGSGLPLVDPVTGEPLSLSPTPITYPCFQTSQNSETGAYVFLLPSGTLPFWGSGHIKVIKYPPIGSSSEIKTHKIYMKNVGRPPSPEIVFKEVYNQKQFFTSGTRDHCLSTKILCKKYDAQKQFISGYCSEPGARVIIKTVIERDGIFSELSSKEATCSNAPSTTLDIIDDLWKIDPIFGTGHLKYLFAENIDFTNIPRGGDLWAYAQITIRSNKYGDVSGNMSSETTETKNLRVDLHEDCNETQLNQAAIDFDCNQP